jgi:hypothetical protein
MYIFMLYVPMKSLQGKPTFYVVYVKITKFGTKISYFVTRFFLSYLHTVGKISVFHKTLCEHVEYVDIHTYIFNFFIYLNLFPDNGSICTWDQKCISAHLCNYGN